MALPDMTEKLLKKPKHKQTNILTKQIFLFSLFGLILYVPVNNFQLCCDVAQKDIYQCICQCICHVNILKMSKQIEPHCEKTSLRGFRPGPTQTGLYSH